jgi:hypothetical protein
MEDSPSSQHAPALIATAALLCLSATTGECSPMWPQIADRELQVRDIHGPCTDPIEALAASLAPEIDALVETSKPVLWPKRRACLYYALAGQRLLARHGIAAAIRTGTVVYSPLTTARHSIHPHFWLETPTHFIDFSTFPRWGKASVAPLDRIARHRRELLPGIALILAAPMPCNLQCETFVGRHRLSFESNLGRPHLTDDDLAEP